jgi:hypothetical protein
MAFLDPVAQTKKRRQRTTSDYDHGVDTSGFAPVEDTGGLDLLNDDYTPTNGNTGVSGLGGSEDTTIDQPATPHYDVNIGALNEQKLADPTHWAKSPKYDMMALLKGGQFNYNMGGDILKALQSGANGRLWQGWNWNGKDRFELTDPSKAAPEWNGSKWVDFVTDFGGPNQSFWWGVDEGPSAPAGPTGSGGAGLPGIDPATAAARFAQMLTRFREPLEAGRASSQQRALERASARGIGLGSGVLEQEAQGIDQGFDRLIGEGIRDLTINDADRADAMGQFLAQFGLQRDQFNASQQHWADTLPLQQLASMTSAMNSVGNQPVPQEQDPMGLISLLISLAGQGTNAANTSQAQNGGFWQSLFGVLPGMLTGLFDEYGAKNYAGNSGDFFGGGNPHA